MTLTPSPLRIDEEATEESEEKDDEVNSDDEGTVKEDKEEKGKKSETIKVYKTTWECYTAPRGRPACDPRR